MVYLSLGSKNPTWPLIQYCMFAKAYCGHILLETIVRDKLVLFRVPTSSPGLPVWMEPSLPLSGRFCLNWSQILTHKLFTRTRKHLSLPLCIPTDLLLSPIVCFSKILNSQLICRKRWLTYFASPGLGSLFYSVPEVLCHDSQWHLPCFHQLQIQRALGPRAHNHSLK